MDSTPIDPTQESSAQEPQAEVKPPSPVHSFAGTKHKVKVDGKDLEVDYDELLTDYQHKKASTKRWEEASKMRKDFDGVLGAFKQGDLSLLKKLVPNDALRKFAETELLEYINWEAMTPEQREAAENKRELARLKAEREEDERIAREQGQAALDQHTAQELESDIMEAVKSLGHDAKITPRLIKRIAEQMYQSLAASDDPQEQGMPAAIAAKRAWKGLEKDHDEYLARVKPEDFISRLPRHLRDAIRKADVGEATSYLPQSRSSEALEPSEPKSPRAQKYKQMATEDWFSKMDKKLK